MRSSCWKTRCCRGPGGALHLEALDRPRFRPGRQRLAPGPLHRHRPMVRLVAQAEERGVISSNLVNHKEHKDHKDLPRPIRPTAPFERSTSSRIAPSSSAPPMTKLFSVLGTPRIVVRLGRITRMLVPIRMPGTVPSPPRRLQPPRTAPAMAYSS